MHLGDIIERGLSRNLCALDSGIDEGIVELKEWLRSESAKLEARRRLEKQKAKSEKRRAIGARRRAERKQAEIREWLRQKSDQWSELKAWAKRVKKISCGIKPNMRKESPCRL